MSTTSPDIPGSSAGGLASFPEEAARQVREIVDEYADYIGDSVLRTISWLIDKIKDMLGHYDKVAHVASVWGVTAAEELQQPTQKLLTVQSDTGAYWSGTASGSFLVYVANVSKCADEMQGTSSKMGESVSGLLTVVTDVYCQCIQFLTDCASALLEATSGIVNNVKNLLGMVGGVIDAINNFMRRVSDTLKSVAKDIDGLTQKALEAGRTMTDIHIPDTLPISATDTDGWDVRPRKDR